MNRHPQWEARLHALIVASLNRPHEFGSFDCLLMPADVVKAVTGKDHGRGHRRKYKSLAGAYRHLKTEFGVDSPAGLLDSLFPEKRVGFAGVGDLVLCHVDAVASAGGEAIPGDVPGVVVAPGNIALVAGEGGLAPVPRGDRWLKAWAVGEHHSGEVAHE